METTSESGAHETRFSRRTVLALAAAGAGVTAASAVPEASFAADPADGPILKPLPGRYFTVYGTNAEMRWDSVDADRHLTAQPRLFVRNHTRTPRIDPHSYRLSVFGDGLGRPAPSRAVSLSLRDLRRLPVTRRRRSTSAPATGAASSDPAGYPGGRHPVEARRGRRGHLGGRPAGRRPSTDRDRARRRRRDGHRPRSRLCRPRAWTTAPYDGRSRSRKALDDALLAWGMDGERCCPTTASRCGWWSRAGSASPASSGSAPSRSRDRS